MRTKVVLTVHYCWFCLRQLRDLNDADMHRGAGHEADTIRLKIAQRKTMNNVERQYVSQWMRKIP